MRFKSSFVKGISIAMACLLSSYVISSMMFENFLQSVYALNNFKFGSVGDWGCNSNTQKTVNNIKSKLPVRVLALGDYSYKSTATCWFNIIQPIDSKTKIVIGNHEDQNSEGFKQYMSHFGLSKPYYSFNYQNVHVLVMATDSSYSSGSSQYNFVKNDLKVASQDRNINWIIVMIHKPLYSSPNTCISSSCKGSTSLVNTYHPLFDKYKVDLVLEGHVHNYQRTYPIKYNPNSALSPIKTSRNAFDYNDPEGEIFVIVGTGGINFHGLSGQSSFVKYQQAIRFGQLEIAILNNENKLSAKFFSNDGTVLDHFSIKKGSSSRSLIENNDPFSLLR